MGHDFSTLKAMRARLFILALLSIQSVAGLETEVLEDDDHITVFTVIIQMSNEL